MPEVSVIIPNYNHAAYLSQRIDSVLSQTYQDFELIILDDCSKDDSRQVIERYRGHPKIAHIVLNDVNTGTPFLQWEKGIKMSSGNWVWIAESDDYANPLFLETLINLTKRHPSTGIAYTGSYWVDEKGAIGKDLSSYMESFFRKGIDEIREKLWYVCTIQNGSAAIFRKDIAQECIRGMGRYRSSGDWIFYVRMLQRCDLAFTGEKLNYFRYYHANTSNWAAQNGLWTTEGVYLLNEIDFRKVKLSLRAFKGLLHHWHIMAQRLDDPRKRWGVYRVLARVTLRYAFTL